MFENFKKALYFPIASYFRFFAKIRLQRWNPRIIVVTGSNGKTTLLHLLASQFGDSAQVSHHANSSFGIPFDILDLHRKTLQKSEWISLFINAPKNVFKPLPKEKIYIVEADADRPNEGKFLAELLQPEVVLWVSVGRTHSMNFDELVSNGTFATVEESIAFEYGYFLQHCQKFAVIDGDSHYETSQTHRTKATVQSITKKEYLKKYDVEKDGTMFQIKETKFSFSGLLPEEIFLSIAMCKEAVMYIGQTFDEKLRDFQLPPGRGSIFAGTKETMLIDSTYNGNLGSIKAMLSMFEKYPAKNKWVVLGDMKELGDEEKEEHESLAIVLNAMHLERVILIGKVMQKYTLPAIKSSIDSVGFNTAPEAASYLGQHINGGEAILFKGSQSVYLEGLIEQFLKNKNDVSKLPRHDHFWQTKRKQLGFR